MLDPNKYVFNQDLGLLSGICGHCLHGVQFTNTRTIRNIISHDTEGSDIVRYEAVFLAVGECPLLPCRRMTVLQKEEHWVGTPTSYGVEKLGESIIKQERIIFPITNRRGRLPPEVPNDLQHQYEEAGSIESLSPNGATFLCRRILEQALRHQLQKSGRLVSLIEEFCNDPSPPSHLKELMNLIRGFGNISAHPEALEDGAWTNVTEAEASLLLDLTKEALDFIYVAPARRNMMAKRLDALKSSARSRPAD